MPLKSSSGSDKTVTSTISAAAARYEAAQSQPPSSAAAAAAATGGWVTERNESKSPDSFSNGPSGGPSGGPMHGGRKSSTSSAFSSMPPPLVGILRRPSTAPAGGDRDRDLGFSSPGGASRAASPNGAYFNTLASPSPSVSERIVGEVGGGGGESGAAEGFGSSSGKTVSMNATVPGGSGKFVQFSNENYIGGKYLVYPHDLRGFRNWMVPKKVKYFFILFCFKILVFAHVDVSIIKF
jgi:hypothetical protein